MSASNILAERYASEEMKEIWSPESKIILERRLWVAILKAQKDLGVNIEAESIQAYENAIDDVNLSSIRTREEELHHDLMARLREFSDLAGRQDIHIGLTSRDITENTEQIQWKRALECISIQSAACLKEFIGAAEKYAKTPLVARTHNMAAQITTLGRRFAMLGEELLLALEDLRSFLEDYPFRGLKGAVGTNADLLQLFSGNTRKLAELEKQVASDFGFNQTLNTSGQVYPRSLDYAALSRLVQLVAGPANFAIDMRLMSGFMLMSEGQTKLQIGSSAMPHKINPRLSERISGLAVLVRGYSSMASTLSQWQEGDVSCSVVRRVILSDASFAMDGLMGALLTIFNQMTVFPDKIEAEVKAELPHLSASKLVIAATKAGLGRERAHEIISQAATESKVEPGINLEYQPLIKNLAENSEFPLNKSAILKVVTKKPIWGLAEKQAMSFVSLAKKTLKNFPAAKEYKREPSI